MLIDVSCESLTGMRLLPAICQQMPNMSWGGLQLLNLDPCCQKHLGLSTELCRSDGISPAWPVGLPVRANILDLKRRAGPLASSASSSTMQAQPDLQTSFLSTLIDPQKAFRITGVARVGEIVRSWARRLSKQAKVQRYITFLKLWLLYYIYPSCSYLISCPKASRCSLQTIMNHVLSDTLTLT